MDAVPGRTVVGLRRTETRTPNTVGNVSPGQDYTELMHERMTFIRTFEGEYWQSIKVTVLER